MTLDRLPAVSDGCTPDPHTLTTALWGVLVPWRLMGERELASTDRPRTPKYLSGGLGPKTIA